MIQNTDLQFLGRAGVNYLLNPGAETGRQGWSLFTTTFSASGPTTITPGAANCTLTSSTTAPLRGTRSLAFAVTIPIGSIGQGFISDVFTVDNADLAKVLTAAFDYNFSAGGASVDVSGTSTQTLEIWVYNVGLAAWTQPAGFRGINQKSLPGYVAATFQTDSSNASNKNQYRIAVIIKNAPSGTFTMQVDQAVVGPQTVQYGAPVTDWVDFTPTFLNATTLNATGKTDPQGRYRRVGDSIEVQVTFQNGSGGAAAGTGDVALRIPAQLTVDTTKLTATVGGYRADGFGTFSTSTAPGQGVIVLNNHLYLLKESSNDYYKIADLSASARWSVKATVPIQGWSSTVQMSNDTDTRVVAARAFSSGSTAVTSGTAIPYGLSQYDTHNALNIVQGRFTAPVQGYYQVQLAGWERTVGSGNTINLFRNGSDEGRLFSFTVASFRFSATSSIYLNAGDYLDLRPDGSFTLSGGLSVAINRLSGPSAIAATESVTGKYENTAGTTLTSSEATVPYATKKYDSHGSFNGTVFTAIVSGVYEFSSTISVQSVTNGVGQVLAGGFRITSGPEGLSAATQLVMIEWGNGSAHGQFINFTKSFKLNAGDTVEVRAFNSNNIGLATDAGVNFFSWKRVGN